MAPLPHGASAEQRKARNEKLRVQLQTLTAWWIRRMVAVEQPFGEKLTFVWHGHFATAATKVRSGRWLGAQNEKLRTHGRGDFRTLAYGMLTDAAMLRWLDGEKNTAAAPNENLSREFMELFTLGHGDGYTETDVREGARALTGWKINPDGTTYVSARQHDGGRKTVLGVTGNLDAAGFCDAVLARPEASGYLIGRLWGHFAADQAPSKTTGQAMSTAYGPHRDLTALFHTLLTCDEFLSARSAILVSPVEWLIGAVRALLVPVHDDAAAAKLVVVLRALGQIPFFPPSVGGWPSGAAWLSTAAAETRLRTAVALARVANLDALGGSQSGRVDAAAHLLGVPAWSDRSARVLKDAAADPRTLIAIALTTPEYLTN
jgi:uncharacterized protein (DUF1800 family)